MMAVRNRVLLLLVTAGATAIGLLGFVTQSPNRLLSGRPVALWQAADPPMLALISVIAVALLVAASLKPSRPVHVAALVLAGALVTLLAVAAGNFAATQVSADGLGRVAPGGGLWIAAFCAAMAMVDALQRLAAPPPLRALVLAAMAALFTALTLAGVFDALSFAREFRSHRDSFVAEFARHMTLVLGSVAPALLIGIPLGIAALRSRRLRDPLFAALNLLQTIPSVALFALLIGPLALLAAAVPFLAAHGVHGIGVTPALIALTLYALLPIARYTFAGLDAVDAAVVESARAMGMTPGQLFLRVEVPLAVPTLIAGLRVVTVQGIGLAVVAALIGAGGLGSFVFQGIGQGAADLVLLGAIPTIGLALAADFLLLVVADLLRRRVAR
jgi:osmoprotectant transport system permease protein